MVVVDSGNRRNLIASNMSRMKSVRLVERVDSRVETRSEDDQPNQCGRFVQLIEQLVRLFWRNEPRSIYQLFSIARLKIEII